MFVDGVEVENNILADEDEVKKYIQYVRDNVGPLSKLKISPYPDGQVELEYSYPTRKFERIRRITGYLVGTIDRWNNAKQAEERERVKHL